MAASGPSGNSVVLSSGNILTKSIAWKKGNDATNEEAYESLRSCFDGPNKVLENDGIYEVIGDDIKNNNENVDREDLKISLKVFLYSTEKADVIDAIDKGLELTAAGFLDTLVITFSGYSEGAPISLDEVKDAWLTVEEIVRMGKAKVVGISDVDTQLFAQLHEWAQIKPGVIQINLASCCVVPPELAEFCKTEGIQLLTTSDPINALPEEKLNLLMQTLVMQPYSRAKTESHWDLKWVVRYQVHLKTRGVLAAKGYTAKIHQ